MERRRQEAVKKSGGRAGKQLMNLFTGSSGLLTYDVKKRMGAEAAYRHPFFTDEVPLPCAMTEIDMSIIHDSHEALAGGSRRHGR